MSANLLPILVPQELLGVAEVAVIKEDGSPQGPKSFVLWNPPLSAPAAVAKPAGHPSHRLQQQTKRDLKRTANQVHPSLPAQDACRTRRPPVNTSRR